MFFFKKNIENDSLISGGSFMRALALGGWCMHASVSGTNALLITDLFIYKLNLNHMERYIQVIRNHID